MLVIWWTVRPLRGILDESIGGFIMDEDGNISGGAKLKGVGPWGYILVIYLASNLCLLSFLTAVG